MAKHMKDPITAPADVLLYIDSYPQPTAPSAVEAAVRFTRLIGGKLSALAVQTHFPLHTHHLANYLIGLADMATEEEAKSATACREGLDHFSKVAAEAGILGDVILDKADIFAVADRVTARVRCRDLCIVPLSGLFDSPIQMAEDLVFGSGRPVLLFREGKAALPSTGLGTVVLAWDGSRCAARAAADALPLLQLAKVVRVLTIVHEKPGAVPGLGADIVRHLQAHGVRALADEVDGAKTSFGRVLDAYLPKHSPDLLVMGAYGQSRLREFILGGATEHVLLDPKIPVLLSH